ncbi:MAG TPA: triphosphoribosyl-dephospho-CoA synthase [Methyloceanibacter sp.]|nr:triphosphoribosyl-dephospho-CoA synthase [Methyloceanibacter sp.]
MTRPLTVEQVARAFHDACLAELYALKPGNVHRFGNEDVGMSVADFEASARVAAPALAAPGLSVGARIRSSVEATIDTVGHNTNLGIVLLSAPLAAAALDHATGDLRSSLAKVLAGLSFADARETYAAIRYAKPGGLGAARTHDVSDEPHVTLLRAMEAAEGRDRIAWNYTHDFADIFDLGLPRFRQAMAESESLPLAATLVYLRFLTTIPDTLIARKFGMAQALEVQQEAEAVEARLGNSGVRNRDLLAFDRSLKARGLNPGTSADLTVATLFAASLQALELGC